MNEVVVTSLDIEQDTHFFLQNATQHRCSQKRGNCNEEYITDPKTIYTVIKNRPLVSYTNNMSEVTQIMPQEVNLNLRISNYNEILLLN
jgi:hypothetical protein